MAGKAGDDKPPVSIEDVAKRANVQSVFGPFNSMALVTMPADLADRIWPEGLASAARPDPVEAVERDLASIRERSPDLAESALASTALVMAYELIDPFNSATSKSMCAGRLQDALKELRELAPAPEEDDALDRIKSGLASTADRQPAA